MGSLKNCGIVRGQRSGNLFLHRQPFFDRGSRSEGSGQILLVGAKVGRHCRSSRLCCEGLQVGRRGRQHLCWSGLQVGGGRVGGMGGFAVRWDGWCSRGGGMSLKNGGFSSRPPATLSGTLTLNPPGSLTAWQPGEKPTCPHCSREASRMVSLGPVPHSLPGSP